MSSESKTMGDNTQNIQESSATALKNGTYGEGPDNQIWEKKEKQLYDKIAEYETALTEEKYRTASLQKELQIRTEERDNFKKQAVTLEKELAKSSLKGSKGQTTSSNDMVTKASSVIFEKTKVCKNQELQIEALTQQVTSLKEIVAITKDMLDIRNMEVKQLQDKLECMELKFTAEKDRHALMHTKLDRMIKLNTELKSEYEKQLSLFAELQEAYRKHKSISQQTAEHDNDFV